jgi:cell wall-associated NlpC family hydrolase
MRVPACSLATALALALALAPAACAADGSPRAQAARPMLAVPASGVIGVEEAYLSPGFWVARLQAPDAVLMDRAAIEAQNAELLRVDDSMHDLRALPATLDGATVRGWIEALSQRPERPRYDVDGEPVPAATLDALVANLALDAVPAAQPTRYGLVLHRAALRGFPTDLRVFSSAGDTDIDRFQESALFPGTPVVVAHESADGEWLFVVSPRYAAWIEADAVAEGSRDQVFGYVDRAPYRVVTGDKVETVFTREQPQLSELQLDMGVRVPLADVPLDQTVNGQHPYTSWILELPIRGDDGRLAFAPALLQKNEESAAGYLPLTRANLIRQAFKFLGERYGWGHSYNGRDCSGFVSEIYRSMGVQVPRNTSAQSVSPAFKRVHFDDTSTRAERMAAVAAMDVGDLVYIPGHVMMYVGEIDGMPYVIHDTNGGGYLGADGEIHSLHLNAVSLTPLLPLRGSKDHDYVDRITNIVRVAAH